MRGWLPSPEPPPVNGRGTEGWQSLPEPIAGHSTIDGVPVPVVAMRRHSERGELEVVRSFDLTGTPVGAAPPPGTRRHTLPALSFIPHPRREVLIDGQRFFFGSVASAVRCSGCGADLRGFGFVTSDSAPSEGGEEAAVHRTLCERCASRRAAPVG